MSTVLGRRKQSGVDKREALHPLQDYVNARGAQAVPLFRSICRTSCHCFLVLCKLNGKANPCSKTLALMSNNRRCNPGKNPPTSPKERLPSCVLPLASPASFFSLWKAGQNRFAFGNLKTERQHSTKHFCIFALWQTISIKSCYLSTETWVSA